MARDIKLASSAVINIKNEFRRKGGISPIQWVLGKYTRRATQLMEEEERHKATMEALSASYNHFVAEGQAILTKCEEDAEKQIGLVETAL